MGNLLGAPKNPRATITDHDRAVLSLKAQRKKLEDRCKQLEKRIDQDSVVARTLIVQHKKQQALLALQRKRLAENQLTNISAYLMNVEGMLSDMELSKQQGNVMAALKQGNEALKKAQQEMPLDDIQSLMDDTAEAQHYQQKVQEVLSQQLDAADNEAVLAELQQLEDAALQEEVAAMPTVPAATQEAKQQQQQQRDDELPRVPQTKLPAAAAAKQQQQQEERQLEAPMLAS